VCFDIYSEFIIASVECVRDTFVISLRVLVTRYKRQREDWKQRTCRDTSRAGTCSDLYRIFDPISCKKIDLVYKNTMISTLKILIKDFYKLNVMVENIALIIKAYISTIYA